MKYKVGDKVKIRTDLIVQKVYGGESFVPDMQQFAGKTCLVSKVYCTKKCYLLEGNDWCWTDEMLEDLTETSFTKSDLKTGMVVEYRNGGRRLVLRDYQGQEGNDVLVGEKWKSFDDIREDLSDISFDGLDIVKVYAATTYCDTLRLLNKKSAAFKVLWERKEVLEVSMEEVAEKFGVDVKNIRIKD